MSAVYGREGCALGRVSVPLRVAVSVMDLGDFDQDLTDRMVIKVVTVVVTIFLLALVWLEWL